MKILHVAYSLGESSAATRIAVHQNETHEVYFFLGRLSKYKFVRERQVYPYLLAILGTSFHMFEILLCRFFGVVKGEVFSIGFTSALQKLILRCAIYRYRIDVVHLHWGGYGFCPVSALEGLTSIKVITAHDYHSFTGGCHVPMGCEQLQKNCGDCPLLENKFMRSVASYGLRERISSLQSMKIKVTAPSSYTRNVIARLHVNLDIRVVPNVLGVQYPMDAPSVDGMLNLYRKRESDDFIKLIVVGVAKTLRDNKGADVLDYVVKRLVKLQKRFKVMVVGDHTDDLDPSIYEIYGNIDSSKLAGLYAAADLCLVPSRYETFSQVTLESIVCCTPVVAFDMTGPKDIIEQGKSGFLSPAFDAEVYYQTVKDHLNYKRENLGVLRECAIKVITQYSGNEVVKAFDELYI
jgi:glycosyltransferase involved in cell wall biosynthesis